MVVVGPEARVEPLGVEEGEEAVLAVVWARAVVWLAAEAVPGPGVGGRQRERKWQWYGQGLWHW